MRDSKIHMSKSKMRTVLPTLWLIARIISRYIRTIVRYMILLLKRSKLMIGEWEIAAVKMQVIF